MTEAECRYAQIEKECLGITYGCSKFHHYIYGLPKVVLETDHKPLVALSNKALNDITPRLQRLMLKLQRYNFEIVWTPGRELYLADALSRANPMPGGKEMEQEVTAHVGMIMGTIRASDSMLERIANETKLD